MTPLEALRLRVLHLVARGALRVGSPLRAKAIVDRVARLWPPLEGPAAASEAAWAIAREGSCLSRALTVGASLPGAEVVLAVDVWSGSRLAAHAWLEVGGRRIPDRRGAEDAVFEGNEIARLSPTLPWTNTRI